MTTTAEKKLASQANCRLKFYFKGSLGIDPLHIHSCGWFWSLSSNMHGMLKCCQFPNAFLYVYLPHSNMPGRVMYCTLLILLFVVSFFRNHSSAFFSFSWHWHFWRVKVSYLWWDTPWRHTSISADWKCVQSLHPTPHVLSYVFRYLYVSMQVRQPDHQLQMRTQKVMSTCSINAKL